MRKSLKTSYCRAFVLSVGMAMIMPLGTMQSVRADPASEQAKAEILRAELSAVGEAYITSYNKHDAAAVASFSTENSELIKWSGDIVRGKDDIRKFFEQTFKATCLKWQPCAA